MENITRPERRLDLLAHPVRIVPPAASPRVVRAPSLSHSCRLMRHLDGVRQGKERVGREHAFGGPLSAGVGPGGRTRP